MVNCRKSLTVSLLAVLFFSSFVGLAQADAGWLEGYNKRMLFYWLSSGAGQSSFTVINQTNFNVANTFYIFNETQPDFEDLNVTLADGVTPLALWNQSTVKGINCTVWANFPTANASYYLYWGNVNASAGWNQSAVFDAVINGVVGAWNMEDETGVNVADSSGNNYNGTATGSTIVEGKFTDKKARSFDGDDVIKVPGLNAWIDGKNAFSMFTYMKLSGSQTAKMIMGYWWNTDAHLRLTGNKPDGYVKLGATFYNVPVEKDLADSQFHLVAVTFDKALASNRLSVYCDNLVAAVNGENSSVSCVDPFTIGALDNAANGFSGVLSGAYLLSSVLSAAQVSSLNDGYPDVSLESGKILVRKYVYPNPSVSLFGSVEVAPVPEPSVDPNALTGEDAVGVAVVFGVLAIAVAVVFAAKSKS